MGSVFQRIYRDRRGNLQKTSTSFLKYRIGDKLITIPTGTQDYQEAVAIIQRKINAATHLCRSDIEQRLAVNQLLDLVIEDYRSKDLRRSMWNVALPSTCAPFFEANLLEQYVASRRDKAAPATVSKELAYLKRAFDLDTGMSRSS